MGRGRAKAKQTKVARKLKYGGGGGTDLERLRRELGAGGSAEAHRETPAGPSDGETADQGEREAEPGA